jgi:hypothetical protein
MAFDQTTIDAANRLAAMLAAKPWFASVGIATDESSRVVFVVYLKRRLRNQEGSVPSEWEGVPVQTQYFGRVRPAESHSR